MYIRYRNYTFTVGLQTYKHRRTPTFNEFYQRESRSVSVIIEGELRCPQGTAEGDEPATLISQIQALENAFAVDEGDFEVTYPTGERLLFLSSADFVGGLRVVGEPSYEDNQPGELVRRRTFKIELAGEQLIGNTDGGGGGGAVVVSYAESLNYEGNGGKRFVVIETSEGPPIVQTVNQRTMCRCIQEGRTVQRYTKPTAPAPLYPDREQGSMRRITPSIPSRDTYEIAWSYVFESPTPF
jgi:hypothetical protein